jgi:hypothetical protein
MPIKLCTLFSLIGGSAFLFSVSSASAHHCRYFKPDARNLCLAKREEARFYCRFIKDPDQQRYCYAYLDKKPNQCGSIQEETLKTQCEAEAQARLDEAIAIQKAAEEAAKAAEEAEAAKNAPSGK